MLDLQPLPPTFSTDATDVETTSLDTGLVPPFLLSLGLNLQVKLLPLVLDIPVAFLDLLLTAIQSTFDQKLLKHTIYIYFCTQPLLLGLSLSLVLHQLDLLDDSFPVSDMLLFDFCAPAGLQFLLILTTVLT